jgi:5-formyltetrahydrofolate cyclo-ligase
VENSMNNSTKEDIRREARARRAGLKAAAPDAAHRIAKNFLTSIPLQSNAVVAGYVAARDELDPAELIAALRKRSVTIVLPRVTERGRALAFHLWPARAQPVKGVYGVFEASPDWLLARPTIVLVPLLAFDPDGFRLGYGGGYYDRSLLALRGAGEVMAVGLAYDGQRIAHIPSDDTDEKLDWVVTEKSARKFE